MIQWVSWRKYTLQSMTMRLQSSKQSRWQIAKFDPAAETAAVANGISRNRSAVYRGCPGTLSRVVGLQLEQADLPHDIVDRRVWMLRRLLVSNRSEPTTHCYHCDEKVDTVYTLEACSDWEELHCVLWNEVREDLSLLVLIHAMVSSKRFWQGVASFCEQVMSQKKAAE